MKLNAEQIHDICQGAVRVNESDTGVQLFRFTAEQEAYYLKTNVNFHKKALAAAGMKLCFETDSRSLFLKVYVTPGSTRTYFSFDVTVDGSIIGHLDNFIEEEVPEIYTTMQGKLGEFSKNFDLGEGTKKVCVYLPWSVAVEIREISVDDNAFIKPLKPAKKLLVFGDSITQGMDAVSPSLTYPIITAGMLKLDVINQGVGGSMFRQENLDYIGREPEVITVAFGCNDWGGVRDADELRQNIRAYLEKLLSLYSCRNIYGIVPIWRSDADSVVRSGMTFTELREIIAEEYGKYPFIKIIDGFKLMPAIKRLYGDAGELKAHPSETGFMYMSVNLAKFLK